MHANAEALDAFVEVATAKLSQLCSQIRADIREELRGGSRNPGTSPWSPPLPQRVWETSVEKPEPDLAPAPPDSSNLVKVGREDRVLPRAKSAQEFEPHAWTTRHIKTCMPLRFLEEMEDERSVFAARAEDAIVQVEPLKRSIDETEEQEDEGIARAVSSSMFNSKVKDKKKPKKAKLAERVLGLVPNDAENIESEQERVDVGVSKSRLCASKIVCSLYFEFLTMGMLFANTLQLGWQTDYMARNLLSDAPFAFRAADIFFCVYFSAEICLRVYVHRCRYFTMWGCGWNMLDVFLVGVQIVEELLVLIASLTHQGNVEFSNGSLMRSVRILRGIKVMRLIRAIRFAEDLQLIVSCLILSLRTFLWTAVLLLMSIYVIAIYITQAALLFRIDNPGTEGFDDLAKWWGSLPLSILSLFEGVSGGVDWNDLAQPLIGNISPWFGAAFVLYMAFCILALMNVITGTFVETVSQQAKNLRVKNRVIQARRLFQEIDIDRSGYISLDEICQHTNKPSVAEFFESVDVHPSEAQYLLEVLDMDNNGNIDFEEFLQGSLRLSGNAKASDLLLVAREMKRFFLFQTSEMQQIKNSVAKMGRGSASIASSLHLPGSESSNPGLV